MGGDNIIVVVIMMSCLLDASVEGKLRVGFYNKSCPNAETIVRSVVRQAAISDQNNIPALLRLHFHDCFVHGCEGSILIDRGLEADEKRAFGHQGVRGFDVVETAKAQLEAVCPAIVSCSDILAMAARDAVFLSQGPWYDVETGRRDGLVSNVTLASHMPDVADSITKLKAKFLAKGLTLKDLVVLSGAHTIGTTACFFVKPRLYEFPGNGGSDPSINAGFLPELKSTCPKDGDVNVRLAMDRGSEKVFDTQIMANIRSGTAVLQSDAALYQDDATRGVVDSSVGTSFHADFAASMLKMGRIGVSTGSKGQIRRLCSSFN
ncbi:peroxidase 43-like [Salvia miltiorrhiza]|uniref:peroxidase 43-like n=1 Tax=Salvia miltiorrhiza TaxID=226208 RepID=UPI0025ABE3AE|nr:peroxidase 43-like [Salvia miltiorrhiza]